MLKGLSLGQMYLYERFQDNNEDSQLFGSIQYLLASVREQMGFMFLNEGVEEYRTISTNRNMTYVYSNLSQKELSYSLEVNDNHLIKQTIDALDCLISIHSVKKENPSRELIGFTRNKYGSFLIGDTGLTLLDEYLIFIESIKSHQNNPFSSFNIEQLLAMVALVMLFRSFQESDIDLRGKLSRCALLAIVGGFRYISIDSEEVERLEELNKRLEDENSRNKQKMKNAQREAVKVNTDNGEKNLKILITWVVSKLEKNVHLKKGDIVGGINHEGYLRAFKDGGGKAYEIATAKQYLKGVPTLYRDFMAENPNCDSDEVVNFILTALKAKKTRKQKN